MFCLQKLYWCWCVFDRLHGHTVINHYQLKMLIYGFMAKKVVVQVSKKKKKMSKNSNCHYRFMYRFFVLMKVASIIGLKYETNQFSIVLDHGYLAVDKMVIRTSDHISTHFKTKKKSLHFRQNNTRICVSI